MEQNSPPQLHNISRGLDWGWVVCCRSAELQRDYGDEFDFDDDGGVERERVVIQEFVERSSGSIRYGFDRLFLVSPQPLTESCVVNHG